MGGLWSFHIYRRAIPHRAGYRKWRVGSTGIQHQGQGPQRRPESGRSVPAGGKDLMGQGELQPAERPLEEVVGGSMQVEVRQAGAVIETSLREGSIPEAFWGN